MAQAVAEWWKAINVSKPEPAIFWEFIDAARNRVTKLYEHGIWRQLILQGPEHQGMPTRLWLDQANARGGRTTFNSGYVISQLADGAFAGKSDRDVAFEACKWWSGVLDWIDTRAKEIAESSTPT